MNNNNTNLRSAIILSAALIAIALIFMGDGARMMSSARAPASAPVQNTREANVGGQIGPRGQSLQSGHVAMMNGGHLMPLQMEEMLAKKLVESGVIDPAKLPEVTELNLLWAFGLANKNRVLEMGPMMDPAYGGAGRFASTGGWTVGKGSPMDHYSMHEYLLLTEEQQDLVEKVAKNVYRPCCKNSAYFPDCNHGMAMLGLLEILASEGADEKTMYTAAEKANSMWFPGYGNPEPIPNPQPKPAGGGSCSV